MKKTFFTLLVMMMAFGAFAQYQQGRMLVGGTVGFSTTKDKSKAGGTTVTHGTNTDFSIAPQFGYFVIDNLAVGGNLDISLSKYNPENDNDTESTTTSLAIAPFVRYYLPQNIFFHGQFGVGTGKYKETEGNVSQEQKFSTSQWQLAVGYAAFLTDNVAVEPMIGYGSTTRKYKDTNPEFKDLTPGLFIKVGFQIYLGKK